MSRKTECAHKDFRSNAFTDSETRASGPYSVEEVREVLSKTGMKDVRQIGCPDFIFHRILARRARALGIFPVALAPVAPVPAASDLDARIAATKLF